MSDLTKNEETVQTNHEASEVEYLKSIGETAERLSVHFYMPGGDKIVLEIENIMAHKLEAGIAYAKTNRKSLNLGEFREFISCLSFNGLPVIGWIDIILHPDDWRFVAFY